MKKKLSFLLAAVMTMSFLPAMSVSAATKNTSFTPVVSVQPDTNWGEDDDGDYSAAKVASVPVLKIAKDSEFDWDGGQIVLNLVNAEWAFDDKTAAFGSGQEFQVRDTVTLGDDGAIFTMTATAGTGRGSSIAEFTAAIGANATPATAARVLSGSGDSTEPYTFRTRGSSEAVITIDTAIVGTPESDDTAMLLIPIIARVNGEGPVQVVIGDENGLSGVTESTVTLATANQGSVRVYSSTANDKSSARNIPVTVRVQENSVGAIPTGDAVYDIRLVAPSGFEWIANPTSDPTRNTAAVNNAGLGSATIALDEDELNVRISSRGTSPNAIGIITINDAWLQRTGSSSSTYEGDLNVTVRVRNGSTETVKVGEFTRTSVTLETEEKELSEILWGVYPNDPTDDSIRALDVTLSANSDTTWNQNGEVIFKLNPEAKFRGVEIIKLSNVTSGLSRNDILGISSNSTSGAPDLTGNGGAGGNSTTFDLGGDTLVHATRTGFTLSEDELVFSSVVGSSPSVTFRTFVSVLPGYTGDITLSTDEDTSAFGGSYSVVIAKAVAPVTVTAQKNNINIGYARITLSDILVKENVAGALRRTPSLVAGNDSYVDARSGNGQVVFSIEKSTLGIGFAGVNDDIEVLSGDIKLGDADTNSANEIVFGVERESRTASEFRLSGITMDANRSVPEGKFALRIGGSLVSNNYDGMAAGGNTNLAGFEKGNVTVLSDYINVIDAAPSNSSAFLTVVDVTIGSNTMYVEDKKVDLDVAPYLSLEGYTMVPVRAIAEAMGENVTVTWNKHDKTVSIINRGGDNALVTIGSNRLLIGGVPTDFVGTPAEITGERTFLPLRAMGVHVLGLKDEQVNWDEASRTASFNRTTARVVEDVEEEVDEDDAA